MNDPDTLARRAASGTGVAVSSVVTERTTYPQLTLPIRNGAAPTGERVVNALVQANTRIDDLTDHYRAIDQLLVGCLTNDTVQAESLEQFEQALAESREELESTRRLVESVATVVRAMHAHDKRRDAELEVLAQRQETILRHLERLSQPALDETSTLELDPEATRLLLAGAG